MKQQFNKAFSNRFSSAALLVVVLATVSSCAIKPEATEPMPTLTVAKREALLVAFDSWRALGSIAVESEEQGKFNASFSWDSNSEGYEIKLFGPLGVQAFQLVKNAQGATLIDRKGQISGDSTTQLLAAVLGVPVPIDKMQDWAVGLPGDAEQIQRDKLGRLDTMVVAENANFKWNVNFKRYTNIDNLDLPKSVAVDGDGIKIQLSFKKWHRSEATDPGTSNPRLIIPGSDT